MAFVAAKCTQCGANLEVDNSLDAAICKYCNTAFIVEKAINNYNTYHQNHYNIENAKLYIQDERSIENKLKNADVFFIKHGDKKKAMEIFQDVFNNSPGDYRGWWGMARVLSDEFQSVDIGKREFNKVLHYKTRALNVAPPNVAPQLISIWNKYENDVNDYINERIVETEELEIVKKNIQENLKEPEEKKRLLFNSLDNKRKKLATKERKLNARKKEGCLVVILYIIGFVLISYNGIGLIIIFLLLLTRAAMEFSTKALRNEVERLEAQFKEVYEEIEAQKKIYNNYASRIIHIKDKYL